MMRGTRTILETTVVMARGSTHDAEFFLFHFVSVKATCICIYYTRKKARAHKQKACIAGSSPPFKTFGIVVLGPTLCLSEKKRKT